MIIILEEMQKDRLRLMGALFLAMKLLATVQRGDKLTEKHRRDIDAIETALNEAQKLSTALAQTAGVFRVNR